MTKNFNLIYINLFVKLQLTEAVCETEIQGGISQKNPNFKEYEELLSFAYIIQIPQIQSYRNIQQNSLSIYQRQQGSVSQKDYFKIVCKSWKK